MWDSSNKIMKIRIEEKNQIQNVAASPASVLRDHMHGTVSSPHLRDPRCILAAGNNMIGLQRDTCMIVCLRR